MLTPALLFSATEETAQPGKSSSKDAEREVQPKAGEEVA